MITLALDTSGPVCGTSILKDGILVYEASFLGKKNHSTQAMPMLERALNLSGLQLDDVDLLAAVTGPGSFTGIRIGLAAINAMAQATGKPVVGVNALEALAAQFTGFDGMICPVIDARSNQGYVGLFRAGMPPKRIKEDQAVQMSGFLASLDRTEKTLFVGDGACSMRSLIEEALGDKAVFPPSSQMMIRPGVVCELAESRYQSTDFRESQIMPHYLRASQAEREKQVGQ